MTSPVGRATRTAPRDDPLEPRLGGLGTGPQRHARSMPARRGRDTVALLQHRRHHPPIRMNIVDVLRRQFRNFHIVVKAKAGGT